MKLEALGEIDHTYVHALDFIWQAMQRASQEAPSDYSGPFASLTHPTQNDLFKVLCHGMTEFVKLQERPIS